MLIDYPKEKKKVKRIYLDRLRKHKSQLSLSSMVKTVGVYEGHQQEIIREDGSRETIKFELVKGEILVNNEELENIALGRTSNIVFEKLIQIAKEMATQESKMFLDKINETTTETGQVVKGEKISFSEGILRMLEMIEIDFDEHRNPILPTLIINPETAKKLQTDQKLKDLEHDPEYKSRYKKIMTKKWEEWRDRESSRKLVG